MPPVAPGYSDNTHTGTFAPSPMARRGGAAGENAGISAMESNRTRSVGGANQTVPSDVFAVPRPPRLNPYHDPASVYGQQTMYFSQRGFLDTAASDATGLGLSGATSGYSQDGGNVGPSAQEHHPPSTIWIESRTRPPLASAVPATPPPSDYTDSMSISSSTIPPSYHTHYSNPGLPSYLAPPLSSNYGSMQEPRAPPSAFRINRSRLRIPSSRTSSWIPQSIPRQSRPPPLPTTGREGRFADIQE
ncbi:hypothetical protein BD311DRAFT_768007 [Dichomitus squalens]|uniref:Uncharacterized protein n=1 Tax=Dichomitus squalens TaxID=114155 RepID=A0A4Q9MCW9_9APHY|nr:hypothetical protein BD311DRAFT_768007 [Dichomitus squalens]